MSSRASPDVDDQWLLHDFCSQRGLGGGQWVKNDPEGGKIACTERAQFQINAIAKLPMDAFPPWWHNLFSLIFTYPVI